MSIFLVVRGENLEGKIIVAKSEAVAKRAFLGDAEDDGTIVVHLVSEDESLDEEERMARVHEILGGEIVEESIVEVPDEQQQIDVDATAEAASDGQGAEQ